MCVSKDVNSFIFYSNFKKWFFMYEILLKVSKFQLLFFIRNQVDHIQKSNSEISSLLFDFVNMLKRRRCRVDASNRKFLPIFSFSSFRISVTQTLSLFLSLFFFFFSHDLFSFLSSVILSSRFCFEVSHLHHQWGGFRLIRIFEFRHSTRFNRLAESLDENVGTDLI